jgi:Protein of unknown function (DUF1573)/HYDIN/CFA65/VesB-like, Ig-like domain
MKRLAAFLAVAALTTTVVTGLVCGAAFAGDQASASQQPAAAPGPNSPKIQINPDKYDFGMVQEGEKPMAQFTIKNVGGSELIIYDAKPSCGCTVAELSSKKLQPGETATLQAVYNSMNARSGAVSKYVTVKSNDPAEPSKILRITGSVKARPAPLLDLSQYRADGLILAAGSTEKRELQLTNNGQEDLLISEVTATNGMSANLDGVVIEPGKTVKLNMVVKPGEAKKLELDITPKEAAGSQFQELFTIRSNAKGRPVMTYFARGVVK